MMDSILMKWLDLHHALVLNTSFCSIKAWQAVAQKRGLECAPTQPA